MRIIGIQLADMAAEILETPEPAFDWLSAVLFVVGFVILTVWLRQYGGPKTLAAAPTRRHSVPVFLPFLIFFAWAIGFSQATLWIEQAYQDVDKDRQVAAQYLALLALNAAVIAVILVAARRRFARGLKGFGLNPKTLGADAGWGAVNLLAVYPLVITGIWLVMVIGRLIAGYDFAFPVHESLEDLADTDLVWAQVLLVVLLAGVVPVMEELLFRGLLQSAFRGVLPGVWPAILITSALFAIVHSPYHAPGIFALSCAMGYAYERSGSLFRPICIHIFFNATIVIASMLL